MYFQFTSVTNIMSQTDPVISRFAPASLDKKWHAEMSTAPFNRLYLVEEGEALLGTDTQHIVMKPGMAYLIPAGLSVWYRCESTMEKLYFHFNLYKPDHYELFLGIREILECPVSMELLGKLRTHGYGGSIADGITVKSGFYRILADIQEKYGLAGETFPVYSRHVRDTISYIQDNLSASLSVEELAQRVYISKSFLSEHFRKEVGVSVGRYIDEQLMNIAQWRLSQTDDSLMEISRELGYSDQCYFSRRFKQLCGMTPQQYRKESRA